MAVNLEQNIIVFTGENNNIRRYMTDIVVESDRSPCADVAIEGFCIFGIGDFSHGEPFILRETLEGRWERQGAIRMLPEVETLDCVLVNGEEDIGFVHLISDGLVVEGDYTQPINTDLDVCLNLSWKIIEFSSDLPVTVEELEIASGVIYGRAKDRHVNLDPGGRDISELDFPVAVMGALLASTPPGSDDFPERMENLATAFQIRFERMGDLDDASQAILHHQRAIQLRPDVPEWHSNLGCALLMRYERTRTTMDLMEGYEAQLKAIHMLPVGHADKARCYNDVGATIQLCFQAFGDPDHLDAAIDTHQLALELTAEGHPYLLAIYLNLGNGLDTRFRHSGNRPDVDLAILAKENVVQLSPEGHRDLHMAHTSLGHSLLARFEHFGDLTDLDAAISAFEMGVELAPEGHPSLPHKIGVVGDGMRRRALLAEYSGRGDFEASTEMYKRAAISGLGSPRTRLICARQWADNLFQRNRESPEMLQSLGTTIQLVSLVAGLDMTMAMRFEEIMGTSTITLEIAAIACELGYPDSALQLLEQGRCMVWSQLSSLRTPLDRLREYDSVLARRFTEVSRELEKAGSWGRIHDLDSDLEDRISIEDQALAHSSLAKEWDRIIRSVRELPGFDTFVMPSSTSSLIKHLPAAGPIVVINVDKLRCDAIVLVNGLDEPLQIPLPNFSIEIAEQYHSDLSACLAQLALCARATEAELCVGTPARKIGLYRRRNVQGEGRVIHDILRGLWNFVVKPVLDGLGFSEIDPISKKPLPRIWWCPTGLLCFLPIHAAGIYTEVGSVSILDYVVSSYTPTVTALISRIQDCLPIDKDISGLFLTSHPDAIPTQRIPGAAREVDAIFSCAARNGVRVGRCDGAAITVDECLLRMEEFSSIHLACHASQRPGEPLESSFHLQNGSLTLHTIIERDLKNADLAFLSACQTSVGEEFISDEAVHLAAGMLAAGYRRVIATMWSIGDQHAEQVSQDFYQYLWEHREEDTIGAFDGTHSAYALHDAVKRLRSRLDTSEGSLLSWIPYVHFGN